MLPEADPRSPVQRLLLQVFLGDLDSTGLHQLFTSRSDWAECDNIIRELRGRVSSLRHEFTAAGLSDEITIDYILSLTELSKGLTVVFVKHGELPVAKDGQPTKGKDGEEELGYRIISMPPGPTRVP